MTTKQRAVGGTTSPAAKGERLLPFEQFLQVVITVRGDSDGRNSGRRDPRAPMRGRVVIVPLGISEKSRAGEECWVRDVSRSGIGISLTNPLQLQTPVAVGMRSAEGGITWLLGAVACHFPLPANGTGHGIRLVRQLSDDEYKRILAGDVELVLGVVSEVARAEGPFTCGAIPKPKRQLK